MSSRKQIKFPVLDLESIVNKFRIKNGYTHLHWAAENHCLDMVKYLLNEKDMDVEWRDRFRSTPLHYAAKSGNLDIVRYLIEEKHADPKLANKYGETPVDLTRRNRHTDVLNYLTVKVTLSTTDKHVFHPSNSGTELRNPTKQNVIGMIVDVIDIAVGVTSILQDVFGIFPDQQSEEFEKVFDAIGKNYDAIQEVGKKVDRNFVAMKVVYDLVKTTLSAVEETRQEMRQGFKIVLQNIEELKVGDKISSLTTFIDDFIRNVKIVKDLSPSVRVTELKRDGGILDRLDDAVAFNGKLHGNLNHIINQQLAIPKNEADNVAFAAFHILYYGIQTYVSIMFFVLEQYSFLADYYYQKGDVTKCNGYFDMLQIKFQGFKESLLSRGTEKQLIDKVSTVLKDVQSLNFVRNNREDIFKLISERITSLVVVTQKIKDMNLPLVADQPEVIIRKPDFTNSKIKTPLGNWKNGALVSYAIQYRDNNTYSKIGDWSDAFTVYDKANPFLKLPVDPQRRARLIFRKFNKEQPQLVGVIKDKYEINFRDIDRDLYDSCLASNEEIGKQGIQILLESGAYVNQTFENGRSAIHAAAQRGNSEIASEFLMRNHTIDINVKDDAGYTPIYIASEAGYENFVGMMIQNRADVNVRTKADELTPLHIAAYKGDVSTVEVLIKSEDTDLNAGDAVGFTPLHSAVFGGTYVINCLSLNKKTEINAKSEEGLTPLHLASINDFEDIVEVLARNERFDVNAEAKGNLTALHFAASMESVKVVKFLVAHEKININAKSADGWTALHFANFLKRETTAMELLKVRGIDVSAKGKNDITPLHIASITDQNNVILGLLKLKAAIEKKTKDGLTALHLSVIHNKLEIVTLLIGKGADIEAKTADGSTSLHLAASRGQKEMLLFLLKKGAKIDVVNNSGRAPIHEAVFMGETAMVRLLLEFDSNQINFRTENGESVLHIAAQVGYLDIVKYLINEKGVDKNILDKNKNVPLHYAAKYGQMDVIKYLIDTKNVECSIKGENGKNALHFAAENGELDVIRYLVDEKHMNIKSLDGKEKSPLHFAAENGKLDVIKYLVDEKKVDMNIKDSDGNYPIHLAASNGFLETLKYFIDDKHADVTKPGNQKKTVLHFATESFHFAVVKYLVEEKNINVDIVAKNQKTCLHFAAENGTLELVKYFVGRKANVNAQTDITNGWCKTLKKYCGELPLHFAAKNGYFEVVKFLVENKSKVTVKAFGIKETGLNEILTPSDLASVHGYLNIVKYLLQFEDIHAKKENRSDTLHWSAFGGNLDIVMFIVNKRGQEITTDEQKDAVLAASRKGHLNVARYLVDNQHFAFPKEVLPYSAAYLDIVRYFVGEKNMDVNSKDSHQRTVLNAAAVIGDISIVNYLLTAKNIDVNARESDGYTPINQAANKNYLEIVKVLAEYNADVNIKSNIQDPTGGLYGDGCSPLHFAVYNSNSEMVKYLIRKGADVHSRAVQNNTPLHGDTDFFPTLDIVKSLVENGADVNSKADYGYTPLFNACNCYFTTLDTVKYLVENGADVNARISRDSPWYAGLTPVSALKIQDDIKKYLLEHGAKSYSPNATQQKAVRENLGNGKKVKEFISNGKIRKEKYLRKIGQDMYGELHTSATMTKPIDAFSNFLQSAIGNHSQTQTIPVLGVQNFDKNSTLLLLDTLIRKITGQTYSSIEKRTSLNSVRGSALKIAENFEKMLQKFTVMCGSSRLNKDRVDFFEIYKAVEGCIIRDECSKIPAMLLSVSKKACPQIDENHSYLHIVKNEIQNLLSKEDVII